MATLGITGMEVAQHLELLLRLVAAVVLGGILGYEREHSDKPAGMRDYILVSLGSALFVIISMHGFGKGTDPARVAAQVVTGVGFLGAGAIMRTESRVRGLTTAAGIWMTAAIGVAVAVGWYLIAVFATGLALIALRLTRVRRADGQESDHE